MVCHWHVVIFCCVFMCFSFCHHCHHSTIMLLKVGLMCVLLWPSESCSFSMMAKGHPFQGVRIPQRRGLFTFGGGPILARAASNSNWHLRLAPGENSNLTETPSSYIKLCVCLVCFSSGMIYRSCENMSSILQIIN